MLDGCMELSIQPDLLHMAGNEGCERLAYYGMSTNLVVYLTKILRQDSATASNNVTNWSGTCYITPLIGGFLSDAFLGRYWTIAAFSVVYMIVRTPILKSPQVVFKDNVAEVKNVSHMYVYAGLTCRVWPC